MKLFIKDLIQRLRWQRCGVKISSGSSLTSNVEIGFGTRINGAITIKGKGACRMGRYCALGADIKIITSNHLYSHPNMQCSLQRKMGAKDIDISKADVEIGNNVWIGDSVTILSGVKIGDGVVIGAGAVVTKDILNYRVSLGIPAKVQSIRFHESICRQLDEICWWYWDETKILRNRDFFNLDLTLLDEKIDLRALIHD